MTNPNDGSLALAVRPAQMRTYAGAAYFVDTDWTGDDFITLWALTGPPDASVLTGYDVLVGAYVTPPDVAQPGGSLLDAGDCRIQDAVYRSGLLYAVYDASGLGRPIAVPTRIDVNTLEMNQIGLYPAAGNAYAYGAIDIDDNDQMCIPLCAWGSARFPSVDVFVGSIGTVTTEFVGPVALVNGKDSFTTGIQPYRWGYYTGCARDPFDDRTMWMILAPMAPTCRPHSGYARRRGDGYAIKPAGHVSDNDDVHGRLRRRSFQHGETFTFDLQNTGQSAVN
jgi:hypothetical protein